MKKILAGGSASARIGTSLVLVLALRATAAEPTVALADPAVVAELKKIDPEKSIEVDASLKKISYFPDNTGHIFRADKLNPAALYDFSYLYLFYFEDYIYLKEWKAEPEAAALARRVLERRTSPACPLRGVDANQDREVARCVLRQLGKAAGIKLFFVRYDEGGKAVLREKSP